MMGDDGEKFGAWPTTWEHCWGEGRWVERFFEALEANADWLTTTTPSAWLADHRPIGRVYVPTGSYAEMGEWALPADESLRLHDGPPRAPRPSTGPRRAGCAARSGATSRSSTARSTTSTSRCSGRRTRSTRCPTAPTATRALDHLYQGQSNDCYWHGLFGGIYISHMRLATYEHLIAAEDLADTGGRPRCAPPSVVDLDLDGLDEVRLAGAGPGRHRRPRRGRRHRRLGHPGRPPRARGGHAPPAGGVPRDAPREHERGAARRRRRRRRRRRPGVDPRHRQGQGARPRPSGSTTTRTSGAPGSSGSCRRTTTAEAWATAARDRARRRRRRRVRARVASTPDRLVVTRAATVAGRRPVDVQVTKDAHARRRPALARPSR